MAKNKSGRWRRLEKWRPGSIPKEIFRLSAGWWQHASLGIPYNLLKSAVKDPTFISMSDQKVYTIVGDSLLNVVDSWGPMYGKAMQIWLSRLGGRGADYVEKLNLDRVYGDWPPLSWDEVQAILDRETPLWRDRLKVSSIPLGVASLSQVHAAEDYEGRKWVVKFLKPKGVVRLSESIAAVETALSVAEPFAITPVAKRFVGDLQGLCNGLRQEMNLGYELKTMKRVRDLVYQNKSKSIRVPETLDELSSDKVIVMEMLTGTKLSDIVSGKAEISLAVRKNLAKKVLSELLVQIFEWGLFHADPHAGNLMLLEDGSVGLYDWGLAGELLESDRKYIAAILRSVMTLDIEKLIDVLQQMALDTKGAIIERQSVRKELGKLSDLAQNGGSGEETPPLNKLIDAAFEAAEKLGIVLPNGLLMMAKSLMTIEGLARGIDEDVAFARVAGPVLFRAAKPEFLDLVQIVKQLPRLAGKWLSK